MTLAQAILKASTEGRYLKVGKGVDHENKHIGPRNGKFWTDERIQEVTDDVTVRRMTKAQIMEKHNITESGFYNACYRFGIPTTK